MYGFPIKKHVLVDESITSDFDKFFVDGGLKKIYTSNFIQNLKTSVKGNISYSELYYLNNEINKVDKEDKESIFISRNDVVDFDFLDKKIQRLTFDSETATEGVSVAVLNGTELPGMASFGARVVENYGGRVISVDNSSKKFEKSVLVSDENFYKISKGIETFFSDVDISRKADLTDLIDTEIVRADVVLIIGIDIAESL